MGADLPGREQFGPIWAEWNVKSPEAQASDALASDGAFVEKISSLDPALRDALHLSMFGMDLDFVGLMRMRLGEHAIHVWDVAVSVDPAAAVAEDAILPVMEQITQLFQFVAKPAGDSFRVRLRTTEPDGDYLLDVGESVTLSGWADGSAVDGEITLPAEALLRLFYGRLDPEHTPQYSAEGIELDRLRAVFPGF